MNPVVEIWTWGANSHGQLALDLTCEQIDKPTKLQTEFYDKIKQIACGGAHSVLLDSQGKLFSCGWNSKKQLGHKTEVYTFSRIWRLSGITFTNIACGWDFSCGVTDEHYLFVWGSNSHGQLGLPKDHFGEYVEPIRLQVNVCAISMGLRHTAMINSKGEVWTTGCGRHGQLGLGENTLNSDRFQKVPKLTKISHIACGQNHTVGWCSEENALYVWGDNRHGQLLLNSQEYKKIFTPQKIDISVRKEVKKLLSGWTNVLLWLHDGSLLTWGRNNKAQLGTDAEFSGKIFNIKLPDDRQVEDVALGSEHTLCMATDKTVWAWGWNEHANTGLPYTEEFIRCPTQVPIVTKSKIKQIFAGGAHNFVVIDYDLESK
ncbi:secretion-regulating guanine nucleotide exchange factor [Vanessa tameamea]|uniref:Secretion-regulating guanine nucleotide exchange factor n=1 Tax=Vanessa tameamea TaxID=334116 RepID=A0A8B8HXQ3_VANTA